MIGMCGYTAVLEDGRTCFYIIYFNHEYKVSWHNVQYYLLLFIIIIIIIYIIYYY